MRNRPPVQSASCYHGNSGRCFEHEESKTTTAQHLQTSIPRRNLNGKQQPEAFGWFCLRGLWISAPCWPGCKKCADSASSSQKVSMTLLSVTKQGVPTVYVWAWAQAHIKMQPYRNTQRLSDMSVSWIILHAFKVQFLDFACHLVLSTLGFCHRANNTRWLVKQGADTWFLSHMNLQLNNDCFAFMSVSYVMF